MFLALIDWLTNNIRMYSYAARAKKITGRPNALLGLR